jgi:hypothetical protein
LVSQLGRHSPSYELSSPLSHCSVPGAASSVCPSPQRAVLHVAGSVSPLTQLSLLKELPSSHSSPGSSRPLPHAIWKQSLLHP